MLELIFFLGLLSAIVLGVMLIGGVLKLLFHVAWIPIALLWALLKVVAAVVVGVVCLVLAPLIVIPVVVVGLVAAVVALPFLLLAAAGAAVFG